MTYYDKSMSYLNEFFELTPISTSDLSEFYVTITIENSLTSLIGQQHHLTADTVSIEFYKIEKNQNNALYFSETNSHYIPYQLINEDDDILLVAIERTIGVVDCNSNRLFNELQLNRGLSPSDIQNKELVLDYESNKKMFGEFYTLFHIPKSHPIHQRLASKKIKIET
ncbi:MAG: hypothetical protein ACRCVH_00260 [Vagococcus fluvialis]|uniref:hypothetical protein n=1 Tax=Vagococcus fluvialis TaxID=2738 RepID=UPI000A35355E|nr:hypothetical protein [Vagococcus fluvialis]MBO0420956.1 hypothetical protein [Vagococcus fluvialis]OTP33702.1 hypothetical protein A5798_000433 [Enterococcus sp. 6C8_DIV0013]